MKAPGTFLALTLAMTSSACGPSRSAQRPPPPSAAASHASVGPDAGGAPAAPGERPFAGSPAEATELISRAIDGRHAEIGACTQAFRRRRQLPHEKITVSFGIDQDGELLGVTTKGEADAELKRCVREAVRGAPFPRSHVGVVTLTKSYEELLVP